MCLEKGKSGLDTTEFFEAGLQHCSKLETSNAIELHSFVVMPDHLHLLIRLLNNTKLEDFTRSFKGSLSTVLRNRGISWQKGYFDRLIRDKDPVDVVVRYMLMNPYRKGLLSTEEKWPYWYCSELAKLWIDDQAGVDKPVPEWLHH